MIVFRSQARGNARPGSGVDVLAVEPEVEDRFGEMVRLSALLSDLPLGVELIVQRYEPFQYWKNTPNPFAYRATKEGILHEQVTN